MKNANIFTKYAIIRTNRKNISIHIRDATITVRAPLHAKTADIDAFVQSKSDWIARHMTAQSDAKRKREKFVLDYGTRLPLLGTYYPILQADGLPGFDGESFRMPAQLNPQQMRKLMEQVYRTVAKTIIPERVAHFAQIMRVSPKNIRVSSAKKCWGSCNAKGGLNFAWRLMMAPGSALDYVVVHELAHLKQMNHSPRFWAIVAKTLPDHKARQKQLKKTQRQFYTIFGM